MLTKPVNATTDGARSQEQEMVKGDSIAQERLRTMLFYGIVIVVAYAVFRVVEPFIVPLAWAAVLVVLAHPFFDWLEPRLGRTQAALIATLGVTLVLIVPTLAALYGFAQQGIGAVHSVQQGVANGKFSWVNREWDYVQRHFPQLGSADLGESLRDWAGAAATFVATKLGTILAHAAAFIFDLCVTILVMFYLFRDSEGMVSRLRELLPFAPEQRNLMLKETEDLIFASVMSTAAGALVQGFLGGVSFYAAGIGAPIFWGVMIAFFSLIPAVGSALIWVPASVTVMVSGHVTKGIVLLAFYGLVIAAVDYVLRPWLISGRSEMGGLVIFISVLGGVKVFGLLGIVLGPIVVALMASLLDLYVPPARHGNKLAKAHAKQAKAMLD
jgi:predicted PurR-regulated permease PerM